MRQASNHGEEPFSEERIVGVLKEEGGRGGRCLKVVSPPAKRAARLWAAAEAQGNCRAIGGGKATM